MAERGGFEPPVEFLTLRRFSKPLLSTTQPPLREANKFGADETMLPRPGFVSALELEYAPVAQLDRAFASGAKGRRFESYRAHHSTPSQLSNCPQGHRFPAAAFHTVPIFVPTLCIGGPVRKLRLVA